MGRHQSDINGILVVDKPGRTGAVVDPRALPTSHDVVQRVRRATGQRRIGHTGTLDPMADGVLVLCLGQATRLVEYYQGHDKVYRAGITLGTATDTLDALGQVTDEQPVPALDRAAVEAALARFRGAIDQVPPLFSALKRDGESLHRKARRGESVTLEARPVVIHELTLVDWMPPARLEIRLRCSAGTYVRSLARDLGTALGTVAHLDALRRRLPVPSPWPTLTRSPPLKRPRRAETLPQCSCPRAHVWVCRCCAWMRRRQRASAMGSRWRWTVSPAAQRATVKRGPQAAWPRPKTTTASSWASCAACTGKMRADGCGRPRSGWPEPARVIVVTTSVVLSLGNDDNHHNKS
ncbi:MAG: tRNA pseudouridine(55) synthase TruB [Caldilineaceae bacterium]